MQYEVRPVRLGGVWRNVLVVSSAEAVDFDGQREFVQTIEGDGAAVEVHHYTQGLLRQFEEDGMHHYWFPLLSSHTVGGGESELVRSLKEENHALKLELSKAQAMLQEVEA